MIIFKYILLIAVVMLSACAPMKKHHLKVFDHKQQTKQALTKQALTKQTLPRQTALIQTTAIQDRSERSLYLVAQAAIHDGQQALAIQLLTILLTQNNKRHINNDSNPTLELAELLLTNNRASEALPYLQRLIKQGDANKFSEETRKNLRLMYARSLAATNQISDAQDSLLQLLQQYPEFMQARHLQIKLFMHMQQWALAHIAINTAIAIQDEPILYEFQADVFNREGKFKDAAKSLRRMLQLDPESDVAISLLSQLKMQQGAADQAEQVLRQFIQKNPSNLRVQHHLARLLIALKQPKKAIFIYEKMRQALPENSEIISALGLLYYQLGQFQHANKQFTQALKLVPNNAMYQFYLATSLEALQKNKQARDLYEKIKPDHQVWAEAQLRLASMRLLAKQYTAGLKYIHAVLKSQPDNAHAWLLLSSVYLVQEKYRKLLTETQGAAILKKTPARLQMNRAIAFEHFKRYEDVERVLKELLHDKPDHADALNFLAYTYAEQGIKLDEAKVYIQRALKLQPDDAYYLDSLAWIYYKQGDYGSAAKIQNKAIKIVKNDATMHEHLGDILWQQNETNAAIQQWKQALKLKSDRKAALRLKIKRGM